MARSSPEKLAAALRANLKRRKQGGVEDRQDEAAGQGGESGAAPAAQAPPGAENPGRD